MTESEEKSEFEVGGFEYPNWSSQNFMETSLCDGVMHWSIFYPGISHRVMSLLIQKRLTIKDSGIYSFEIKRKGKTKKDGILKALLYFGLVFVFFSIVPFYVKILSFTNAMYKIPVF